MNRLVAECRASAAVLVLLGVAGCQDDRQRASAAPPCKTDGGGCMVVGAAQGGTSGGGGGAGAGGASAATEVTGVVRVLIDAAFAQSQVFAGEATITADKAGGGTTSAPYGGVAGPSFTLPDVAVASEWFLVEPGNLASDVLPTYSVAALPAPGTVSLPVVAADVLEAIASSLPVPTSIDDGAAQVILLFTRGGMPLGGVKVEDAAGAIVAYDEGSGVYSNDAVETGAAGVVLLLNDPAPTVETDVVLHVTDADSKAFTLPSVRIRAGAATYALVAL